MASIRENTMTDQPVKLHKAVASFMYPLGTNISNSNPWSPDDIDKMEVTADSKDKKYKEIIKTCRFFYQHDSIVSTVINKMIDIGITKLIPEGSKLTANEERLIKALIPDLEEFAEKMALEYLLTGLIIPEIKFNSATRIKLKELGIKRFETLQIPESMWVRDPATVKIRSSMFMDEPSYFVKVPDELIHFIRQDGTYADGGKDPDLLARLKALYPEFVAEVKNGATEVLLENSRIVRRNPISNNPYPIPYLSTALESLKHKRNLKRMDYSVASRVISAIQLFKLGSDEFPVTEDQQDQFDSLKDQIFWRNTGQRDIDRIFMLFAPHTLDVSWVFPPVDTLLDERKYLEVNEDIILSLGFPRILITGETQRTGTSNPEFAMMSPAKTMEKLQNKLLKILNSVIIELFDKNKFKGSTKLRFEPINLVGFADLSTALSTLYNTGNISRTSFAKAFGYDFEEELDLRDKETDLMEEMGIPEFEAQPFSPTAPSQGKEPVKKQKPPKKLEED